MAGRLFDEMKGYVGFGEADERHLRELQPRLQPHFVAIIDDFYERIQRHPGAMVVLKDLAQIERLKGTLRAWLGRFFAGPWDDAYYEQRARIGRKHVEIGLEQQYMFTAMNAIRQHITTLILGGPASPDTKRDELLAVDKLLDMELAIMLHTYREDYLQLLQRQERLATFGQLTSTIAHELRNPLGVIDSSLYLLRSRLPDDEAALRHVDKIQSQVKRSNRLIGSLLDLVRERPPRVRPTVPAELASRAASALEEDRGRSVRMVVAAGLPTIEVDPDQVHLILQNLLANAVDAAGPEGEVRLDVDQVGQRVRFVVSDSGPGVDPAVAKRLFEPLFTTKSNGTGLGLALCRKLTLAHGGSLTLGTGSLPGAAFVLELHLQRS